MSPSNATGRPLGWRSKCRNPGSFPRFDLRVVLIATALTAFIAWQGGLVIARRQALARADNYISGGEMANPLRLYLGDQSIFCIFLHADATDAEVAKYANLFPEAKVQRR